MYRRGETTGSNEVNRRLAEGFFKKMKSLSPAEEELLFDPQKSGGLLLAVPSAQADRLVMELRKANTGAAVPMGEVIASTQPSVCIL